MSAPNPDETWSYADFAERAGRLLEPLAALMRPGDSHLPIEGPPSDHGEAADRFEAFARPCLLAALWLRSTRHTPPANAALVPEDIAAWFREGLALGTDPDSDKFWGVLPSFHQFAVEMAILVMALDIADDTLWEPLPEDVKARVAAWLSQIRGHAGHHNNHLFFDLLVLEFLSDRGFGTPEDRPCIDWLFNELETMHRADGWFIDGTNENYDHYNAYAFHVYGLYWAWRYGGRDRARAERWTAWAARFVPAYARFFSSRGEPVPFGRSLTYRFNGVGVFPMAAAMGIDTLGPGVGRRISRRCIDYFMSCPIEQQQGCLSIGWTDEFLGIAERYSCAGSPYWAAKGLLMLVLEPDHAFFTSPEEPMPSETDAPPAVIAAPGYVVRNVAGARTDADTPGGEVELINAGGWSSFSAAARFGQWKWGRLAYRTGVGSLYSEDPAIIPPDAALTAARPGATDQATDEWFGRHKTLPVAVGPDHLASTYTLSAPKSGFNVSVVTDAWWRGNALLLVHRVRAFQPSVLRSGGFALHGEAEAAVGASDDRAHPGASVSNGALVSTAQPLAGWATTRTITHETDRPRQHLYGPGAMLPCLEARIEAGEHRFAEIIWCGDPADGPPTWSVESSEPGRWVLRDRGGALWDISSERLPGLP